MSRQILDEIIGKVREGILKLSKITKRAVNLSIEALKEENTEKAREVDMLEKESDLLNLEIENLIMEAAARHQPVAGDLRFLHSMLKISSNYERVSDISQKIAGLKQRGIRELFKKPLESIAEIKGLIVKMIELNERAIIDHSTEPIKQLHKLDDQIDKLHRKACNELMDIMLKDPKTIPGAVNLLFVVRYLERIGDIVAKSGARIVYAIEGKRVWIK